MIYEYRSEANLHDWDRWKMSKTGLIDFALRDPLEFSRQGKFDALVHEDTGLDFRDLRTMVKRIYNLNERALRNQSDASKGVMGWANKSDTASRIRKYYRKIERRRWSSDRRKNKVIVAEGDSWFQFPYFVSDIIDRLMTRSDYAIYAIAYGGDWITNIIHEGKYVEELSIHAPDVFLMSGGGNDMVGANKLAIMVDRSEQSSTDWKYQANEHIAGYEGMSPELKQSIYAGQKHILKEFYAFLITVEAQYMLILQSIKRSRLDKMKVVLQG